MAPVARTGQGIQHGKIDMASIAVESSTSIDDVHPDEGHRLIGEWRGDLSAVLLSLGEMAGATEDEFLRIGGRLQEVYQRTTGLTRTAERLVEIAAGERIGALIERLHHILTEMERYLGETETTGANSFDIMTSVSTLLQQVAGPLEVFKRMGRTLYMFEVSIKIESAHLGDMGDEFVNLAMDIKKLSQQIKAKAGTLHDQRLLLVRLLKQNIDRIGSTRSVQINEVRATLAGIENGLAGLHAAHEEFAGLGGEIGTIAQDNARHLSSVVESMQLHDILRQQVEHIIESLEGLDAQMASSLPGEAEGGESWLGETMSRVGDVCELQEAQLQFASGEFSTAVENIVARLGEIVGEQRRMAAAIANQAGVSQSGGSSFIDEVSRHMSSSTALLAECSQQNHEMAATMQEITSTVEAMTGYVNDITEIGEEIIDISLNARIKAATTGTEGDSLSVLAEEIGTLSQEAVRHTDTITATLTEVHGATSRLSSEVNTLETTMADRVMGLESESATVLDTLGSMGGELVAMVDRIEGEVAPLARELESIGAGVDVHVRTSDKAGKVIATLKDISDAARLYHPATDAFKQDLRRMAEKYTMESERRIHEAIARRNQEQEPETQGGGSTTAPPADGGSEFGDNVDLF